MAAIAILAASCGGDDGVASTTTALTPSGEIPVTLDPSELLDSFPSEVPLPELVIVEEAEELIGATTIYNVTGWHDGEPVPLGEAYLAELRAAGMEITSRTDTDTRTFYVVQGDDWFVSAGFFPDPIREAGTSIGVTIGPASSAPAG